MPGPRVGFGFRAVGDREEYAIAEVSPTAAGPILQEYVTMEPITRPFFGAPVNASVAAFAADATKHPVFRLRSPNTTKD